MDHCTSENSEPELSGSQLSRNRLGMYLCYLVAKKNASQTTIEENQKIELLSQCRDAGYPDPELMLVKVCPWGLVS